MMFAIHLQGGIPIYEQLKKTIVENVLLGVLEPDQQLPSVRTLSKELGVNPNTVQKAYQALEGDGIIYSLSGKGSFISPKINSLPAFRRDAEKKLTAALKEALLAGIKEGEILELMQKAKTEYLNRKREGVTR